MTTRRFWKNTQSSAKKENSAVFTIYRRISALTIPIKPLKQRPQKDTCVCATFLLKTGNTFIGHLPIIRAFIFRDNSQAYRPFKLPRKRVKLPDCE